MWIRFSLRHHRHRYHHFFRNYLQRNMHMNQSQGNLSGLSSNLVFPYLLVSPVTPPPLSPSTTPAGGTNQECKKLYAELFIPLIVSNSSIVPTDNQGGDCKQRRYCFERPIHETLSGFLSNLVSTINSRYLKGNCPTVNQDTVYLATQADLLLLHKSAKDSNTSMTEFNKAKTLEDCFLSDWCTEEILLQINFCVRNNPEKTTSLVYQVQRNPARMFRCRLSTIPMVGYPMLPCIEGENICLTKSEFLWFVGQVIH
ncbi:unnamed protein product [Trichobilharzia regenti]|nr:unnamed protein product [Trichobilharzia regenti]